MEKMVNTRISNSKILKPSWNKCNNLNIRNTVRKQVIPKAKEARRKLKANIHINHQASIQIKNFRSEGGNGLIPSFKVSVHVPEEGTLQHCQVPPSLSLAVTTLQEKPKVTPILMTPIFLT
jgi:hypothetical protein